MSPGSKSDPYLREETRLAGRKRNLRLRAQMVQSIRTFFVDQDYLEVETPQLISAPAPEMHIEAIGADGRYLHPSPELCMKRLLAAGLSRIFQISRCFRKGERGDLHLPEFTLLEWYRTGIDYQTLMEECEALIRFLAKRLTGGEMISYRGRDIDLRGPWERISVRVAFDRYASLTLERALSQGCFDQALVEEIEPHLGNTRPTCLYDYPAPLAALARLKPGNTTVAERFEIYLAGVEIANGFSELNDPNEQRARFEAERRQRAAAGKEGYPLPERFLQSLEDMPEAAGIALGVDRLAMVFCDASHIDQVVSFTPEET
ncbi:MAG: elongation factor P--(R)-beta-lysine ligase [Thermodesulfobacteriota bacterium]|nr:elongation factor P--(R)-beta-lysine ligase [Thermodesulfobacteriota bacterium]